MKTNKCDAVTPVTQKQKWFLRKIPKSVTPCDASKIKASHQLALYLYSFQGMCDAVTPFRVSIENKYILSRIAIWGRASQRLRRHTGYLNFWRSYGEMRYG